MQIGGITHYGTLSIRNWRLMMAKLKNLSFESLRAGQSHKILHMGHDGTLLITNFVKNKTSLRFLGLAITSVKFLIDRVPSCSICRILWLKPDKTDIFFNLAIFSVQFLMPPICIFWTFSTIWQGQKIRFFGKPLDGSPNFFGIKSFKCVEKCVQKLKTYWKYTFWDKDRYLRAIFENKMRLCWKKMAKIIKKNA
jgi:hypothetical protein